ncbi:MAG TPA: phenylalanine--tRNA ligase subunit beta [Phycisphaerales bacterium]|nr:phenylalanine--tRNA ligase subunit beta [Phycisphaerales bacterium]
MKASVAWINQYLVPGDLTAEEAEQRLTFAGMPIDATEPAAAGDVRMEVELTSNRGDCLCHVGLAREVAATSGRAFKAPSPPALPASAAAHLDGYTLNNGVREAGCPRFTLRLIKGVKVGPSPAWLKDRLESIGQRSINNVVDVTNFVLHELGQPSHVFDAATLNGKAVSVRPAAKGEKLALLDGTTVTLGGGELVICDAGGPVSLAGVMGGEPTSVTEKTTDVLLEVATWEPVAVRTASRRHNKRTDSSHRYERTVDPRTMDAAAARLVELIVQVAGGRAVEGVLDDGVAARPLTNVRLRSARIAKVLGIAVDDGEIARALRAHGFTVDASRSPSSGAATAVWSVNVPPHRPDVSLEIDLIEEVARTIGYDRIPVSEKLAVAVPSPQASERARREMARVLTAMGFLEAVTFSFTSARLAKPFTPAGGAELVSVGDDRRGDDNICRPSVLCGLLECRRHNQDNKSTAGGPLRLFEVANVFGQHDGKTLQRQTLALVMDVPGEGKPADRRQLALRQVRAAVEQLAATLSGAALSTVAIDVPHVPALEAGAAASVVLGGKPVGWYGLLTPAAQSVYGLQQGVAVAELDLDPLLAAFPPRATVKELPVFPPTERDLSLIVDEQVTWSQVEHAITTAPPALMERLVFVTTYRGQPVPAGRKSVTLRMTFRAGDRTLRDEEVNPSVDALVKTLGDRVGATVRTV